MSTAHEPDPRWPDNLLSDKEFERLMHGRAVAQKALDDRRDKAWRIFSWASSILLAVTGGAFAIARDSDSRYPLQDSGALLIIAVIVLAWYSCAWIEQNQRLADNAGRITQAYDEKLGFNTGFEPKTIRLGYIWTLRILAIAAALSVFLVGNPQLTLWSPKPPTSEKAATGSGAAADTR